MLDISCKRLPLRQKYELEVILLICEMLFIFTASLGHMTWMSIGTKAPNAQESV